MADGIEPSGGANRKTERAGINGATVLRLLISCLAGLTVAACGGPDEAEVVDAYCAYGAKSEAQWKACREHISIEDVRASDSRAAACALEGSKACERHGPYWETWQEYRSFCSDPEFADPKLCREY